MGKKHFIYNIRTMIFNRALDVVDDYTEGLFINILNIVLHMCLSVLVLC